MASRPRTPRFRVISIIPGVGQGISYGAVAVVRAILSENEEAAAESSSASTDDPPSFPSLELHDGDTEPFAMVRCPHCMCETAFPLRLPEAQCEACGGCIRASNDAPPRA